MLDPTLPLSANEPVKQAKIRQREPVKTSWQPGQSGNPNGRPKKGYSITEAFKEMLGESREKKQELINKIWDAAIKGDMTAAKMIWSYMDGQPLQATDITSMGEKLASPHVSIDTQPKEDDG